MEKTGNSSRVVIECRLKKFISEDIVENDTCTQKPEKKTIFKVLQILETPFELVGQEVIKQFAVEKEIPPPPPHPNNLNGANVLCSKTCETLGYKYSEYSRQDKYKKEGKKEIRIETGFCFFIRPELNEPIEEVLKKINTALQNTEELVERFSIRVFKEIRK